MAKKNKKNYRGKAAMPDPTTVSKALPTPYLQYSCTHASQTGNK